MAQSVKLGTAKNGSSRLWLPALAAVLICAPCSAAQSTGSDVSKVQFAETIARIRTGETSTTRTNNAANLATFTRSIEPKKVNDATLNEIVSLLNTDDDGVRLWVAASLGNLGPRARIAVPTLLDLLRKVDCLEGELTSAGAIRLALTRIGKTPPPEPKCFPKRNVNPLYESGLVCGQTTNGLDSLSQLAISLKEKTILGYEVFLACPRLPSGSR